MSYDYIRASLSFGYSKNLKYPMYKYKVLENKMITPSVCLLSLVCKEGGHPLLHEPGQYASISLRNKSRPTANRCFSIVSSPTEQQILQFSVRVGGKFTSALPELKSGDNVDVRGPFGNFIFNKYIHENLVLFAGGIGIAPFISVIRYATELNLKNKIHLVYSCRNQDDIPFREELIALQETNKNLQITFVISDNKQDKLNGLHVISGRIDETTINQLDLNYQEQTYMVCGPAPYMNTIFELLKQKGVPNQRILSEAFSQSARHQSGSFIRWPSNIYVLAVFFFIVSGFFITTSDLLKTSTESNSISELSPNVNTDEVLVSDSNLINQINSIGPQVETNITPEPIIKNVSVPAVTTESPVVANSPAVAPITVQKVAPTPTKTVIPVTRPKTQVS